MFDEEFYPTPASAAFEALEPVKNILMKGDEWKTIERRGERYAASYNGNKYEDLVILDPSGGKGDFLQAAKAIAVGCEEEFLKYEKGENLRYDGKNELPFAIRQSSKHKWFAIEQNHDLCTLLEDHNYPVIDHDFLSYSGQRQFDLILMNPPFSNADEHFLKAFEILREGKIVCLMNKETYDNPYTKFRQAVKTLIDKYSFAPVKYLGKCFKDSERPTDVEVICVYVERKAKSGMFDPFDGFQATDNKQKQFFIDEQNLDNQVMRSDFVDAMIDTVESMNSAYIEWIKATKRLQFYYEPLKGQYDRDINEMAWKTYSDYGNKTDSRKFNAFVEQTNELAWEKIFGDIKMQDIMTSKVRQNFEKFKKQQGCLTLSRKNVFELFDMLIMNKKQILEQNLEEVFETMTKYTKENREYFEGWKTNDCWKVNRKVILPREIKPLDLTRYPSLGDRFEFYNYNANTVMDIDRAMCYIKGTKLEYITTIADALKAQWRSIGQVKKGDDIDGTCESTYFNIRFWKKGTLHITFKDEWLWQEFNRRVCLGKGWLPPEHSTKNN
jgi:hypothetical protein